jgi:hypothetical protein
VTNRTSSLAMGCPTDEGSRKKLDATSAAVVVASDRMVKWWMPGVSCKR